jgi:peptidoglycan/LPS O-acetylase OafA/YrhL
MRDWRVAAMARHRASSFRESIYRRGGASLEREGVATRDRSDGLDLVRSIAIMMVLVSHCGESFCYWYGVPAPAFLVSIWGFYGVELFFVLSGFLIGRLLIDIIASRPGPRSWAVFLIRRWMRTLPLYFLCLAILALVWPPTFWRAGYGQLPHVLPWYITLTQNLAWPMVSDWFGATWSLTIEEWFYLTFSAVLLAGAAATGPRFIWVALALFLGGPLLLRWNLPPDTDWGEVTRKVVIYRLDAIAFGTVIAQLAASGSRLTRRPVVLLCIGAAIVAAAFLRGQPRGVLIFDVVSIGFALTLPAAARAGKIWLWVAVPVRLISRQSYCLYLIHLPLLEMISYYRAPYGLYAGVCVMMTPASLWLLSYLSYRWIERPVLAWRPKQHSGVWAERRRRPNDYEGFPELPDTLEKQ